MLLLLWILVIENSGAIASHGVDAESAASPAGRVNHNRFRNAGHLLPALSHGFDDFRSTGVLIRRRGGRGRRRVARVGRRGHARVIAVLVGHVLMNHQVIFAQHSKSAHQFVFQDRVFAGRRLKTLQNALHLGEGCIRIPHAGFPAPPILVVVSFETAVGVVRICNGWNGFPQVLRRYLALAKFEERKRK